MRIFRLLFLILVPIFFIVVPTSYFESGHSLCLVKNLFGLECPGCGLTRALSALAHGDFVSAIRFNRSVVIVGPLLVYTLTRALFDDFSRILELFVTRDGGMNLRA